MESGYIYVLINSKIPGLTKIGKTTRSPEERAAELSGSTGVPSPFIGAFQQPVQNCSAAELWVHGELERHGLRHAMNREFFDGPLHQIVAVVAKSVDVVALDTDAIAIAIDPQSGDPFALAKDLYNVGEAWELGTGGRLPDAKKALQHYLQSAATGFCPAYVAAGEIYLHGARGVSLTVSIKSWHYTRLFILRMRNDGHERTV